MKTINTMAKSKIKQEKSTSFWEKYFYLKRRRKRKTTAVAEMNGRGGQTVERRKNVVNNGGEGAENLEFTGEDGIAGISRARREKGE